MNEVLHRLFGRYFAPRIKLGEAMPISGDMLISFRGSGEARFRMQHTGDQDGEPDQLSWCDVSMMSNGLIEPHHAIGRDFTVHVLVDQIDGDRDVRYRRYRADWLRIIPFEEEDEEARRRCKAYTITLRSAPS